MRVGILDIAAATIVVIVIILPAREPNVGPPFPDVDEQQEAIAEFQARLVANPQNGAAAERLAETLTAAGYHDWGLRVAGEATQYKDSPTVWRAFRGLSTTHAERFEVKQALAWGEQALSACNAGASTCPTHEQIRLQIYVDQLRAGLQSGIDPRVDPEGFRRAISGAGIRNIRIRAPSE